VHHRIKTDAIKDLKTENPDAEFIMHPECGCMSTCLPLADKVLSTEGMVRYAAQSPKKKFIVGTETGILHRMERDNPTKTFIPSTPEAVCEFMKMITVEKVLWSLQDLKHRITVPKDIADRARLAIDRMIAIV
jgi:quinolinate synthase